MRLLGVCPIAGATCLLAGLVGWPLDSSVLAGIFDLASGALLVELALLDWARVPFACAHVPSPDTVKTKWLVYTIPLIVFVASATALQIVALRSWSQAFACLALVTLSSMAAATWNRHRAKRAVVSFDERSDGLELLNLSSA